ncbi:MAG TPA: 4-hydroxy-tetrahydrodipicolinate reductase [Chthoniobacteraceae bacterium]|nr:4-hydroxy-tetrahydrodipicolinate reductase [Chthoniobacteraceae bacterium]
MPAPLRLLINGAKGRMGQTLIACAKDDSALQVAAEIDMGDDFAAAVPKADAIIDFSHHSIVEPVLARCLDAKKTLVIGTTGYSDRQVESIRHAAAHIPIVFAPNYSVGVNTLFWLTRKAAEILGPGFDLEVVEMHHRLKKDAPSGTAKRLAEILAEVRKLDYNKDARHGRHGIVGERTPAEIGVHAIRGGDVVGDHTVIFATQGERVELSHKASSRETFARGALRAVQWAHGRAAGLYDMQDVLGLK